ncbi:DNA-binding protein [Streptococcus agalactiae]|uniref:DNA-binding protein n=1 Tax=Streptococcus agalactiae TaxID=1311 RepID=UPI0022EA8946|nr:DNA-binding protein [Streptococcus agalactiae]
MKIKYVPVDNALAEWGDKKSILVRWEGLNPYTLNRWISEMRNHKQFRDYVINPTHKLVFINLEGFEEFLRWKQKGAVK